MTETPILFREVYSYSNFEKKIAKDSGRPLPKPPDPERHIIDPRVETKPAPVDFNDWYKSFKPTRAHSRAWENLEEVKKVLSRPKTDDDQIVQKLDARFSCNIRIPIFETCYLADCWTEDNSDPVEKEKHYRNFIKDIDSNIRHIKSLSRSFEKSKTALDYLADHLLIEPLKKNELTLRVSEQKFIPAGQTLIRIVDAMEKGFSEVNLHKDHLEQYFNIALPSIGGVKITHPVMCFGFPGKSNFTTAKKLKKSTALYIWLTSYFRALNQTIEKTPRLSDLKNIGGKPFEKQSASIALCVLDKKWPADTEIKNLIDSGNKFINRNPDVFFDFTLR